MDLSIPLTAIVNVDVGGGVIVRSVSYGFAFCLSTL